MWAVLNHTTCSLNMNYIHLPSTTSQLHSVAAFVERMRIGKGSSEEDSGLDLNEVILISSIQQLSY